MAATPLATVDDVAAIWDGYTTAAQQRVAVLILKASAKLRFACPFDVDERLALFAADPTQPTALDPTVVADVTATIVKRFLVNTDGYASRSEGAGPFSRSGTFVNRYDKTGTDVRGALQVTESDINQLRPAVPASLPSSFRVGVPEPQLLIPSALRRGDGRGPGYAPVVVPDYAPGSGVE